MSIPIFQFIPPSFSPGFPHIHSIHTAVIKSYQYYSIRFTQGNIRAAISGQAAKEDP